MDTESFNWLNSLELNDCYVLTERPSYVSSYTNLRSISFQNIIGRERWIERHLIEGSCFYFYEKLDYAWR